MISFQHMIILHFIDALMKFMTNFFFSKKKKKKKKQGKMSMISVTTPAGGKAHFSTMSEYTSNYEASIGPNSDEFWGKLATGPNGLDWMAPFTSITSG
jgi:hypothetical protein